MFSTPTQVSIDGIKAFDRRPNISCLIYTILEQAFRNDLQELVEGIHSVIPCGYTKFNAFECFLASRSRIGDNEVRINRKNSTSSW